jgi:glycosyltransferase involved in cell wall biosynthesis
VRVLLVNDYGTPAGGAELQMLALREGLRAAGHDARLFSSCASLVPAEVQADYTCYGTTVDKLWPVMQTFNLSAARRLRSVLAQFRPEVVHVRMFLTQLSPLIMPLLRDVPSLYQVAFYRPICPRGTKILPDGRPCREPAGVACLTHCLTPQSWVVLMMQLRLFRRWRSVFRLIVALSHAMARRLEAEGFGPVEVVHNGVAERPPRPPLAGPPVVAYAGRLAPEKGVDVLLRAVARVRASLTGTRLLIAGDGPERDRLRALAAELGLGPEDVSFLGHLPHTELERRLDLAWVQAVPSLWDEPFGNVTTEAMMRGTAVVASAVGAQPEIVRDNETGVLVPPGDASALAGALVRVVGDQSLAERFGLNGRGIALSEFAQVRVMERFVELYDQLLPRRAASLRSADAAAVAVPPERDPMQDRRGRRRPRTPFAGTIA